MTALTDVLAKHHMAWFEFYAEFRCDCGERFHYAKKFAGEQHAAHVEAELAAAGIVAVQLPEADAEGQWNAGADTVFRDKDGVSAVVSSASEAQLVYPFDPIALAAALLAAASVADRPTPTPGDPTP